MHDMKTYQRPAFKALAITHEQYFLASKVWYEQEGEGNFDFEIENDETWG